MMRNTLNQCLWLFIAIIIWIDQVDGSGAPAAPGPKGTPAAPAGDTGDAAAGFFQTYKMWFLYGGLGLLLFCICVGGGVYYKQGQASSRAKSGVPVEIEPPVANIV